jgi:hypothetical protein
MNTDNFLSALTATLTEVSDGSEESDEDGDREDEDTSPHSGMEGGEEKSEDEDSNIPGMNEHKEGESIAPGASQICNFGRQPHVDANGNPLPAGFAVASHVYQVYGPLASMEIYLRFKPRKLIQAVLCNQVVRTTKRNSEVACMPSFLFCFLV